MIERKLSIQFITEDQKNIPGAFGQPLYDEP
jgi:hypothetical protein